MYTLDNFVLTKPSQINWRASKANIIYIPLTHSNFKSFYTSTPLFKQIFRTIIVPTNSTFMNRPIRSAKYISQLKQEIRTSQIIRAPKASTKGPVIVDLTLVSDVAHQLIKSVGKVKTLDEFFKYIDEIFKGINTYQNISEYPTIVVFDNSGNSLIDIQTLAYYFKSKAFELPYQITNKLGFVYFKDLGYFPILTESQVLRQNILRLIKYSETLKKTSLEATDVNPLEHEQEVKDRIEVPRDIIEKVLNDIYKKKVNDEYLEMTYTIVSNYIRSNSALEVNWSSPEQVKRIIEEALKYSNKLLESNSKKSIPELIKMAAEHQIYYKEVPEEYLENQIKPLGISTSKVVNLKKILDPKRTKYEFDINLDKVIEELIKSLDDPKFGLKVYSVDKKVIDDSANRLVEYSIKLKPKEGRAYRVALRIPALVHDMYFKINGEYYVINNQLMQKPIIKKSDNAVQLKTNYSVITYDIHSSSLMNQSYEDMVQKFLNDMKSSKRLKKAEVIDNNTEETLKAYGVDPQIISNLTYKNVEIKL